MANAIGVDIGGTTIKSALMSPDGKVIRRHEIRTEPSHGAEEIIRRIFFSIREVKQGNISGIGIGCPGPMDHKKGIITNPVNLPFKNIPLRKIIAKRFKVPVFVDNDANCFALAEALFGKGKSYENVIGITLGTGFGGGLVIGKKLYYGRGNAAELGHMSIKYDGLGSKSKNTGSIEEYVSSRGIKNFFDGKTEPKHIQDLALDGNKKALATYKKIGFFFGYCTGKYKLCI